MTDATIEDIERAYREHGPRLWQAVFAYSGDAAVADDAVAEAFAQAIRRGEGLRDPMSWIWWVAFRTAAGELKRRRRDALELFDTGYEMPESAVDVYVALGRLSPKQRGSVVLHHLAGFPVKEVAQILGSTPTAVRVHLSAGRKRLRSILEDPGDG